MVATVRARRGQYARVLGGALARPRRRLPPASAQCEHSKDTYRRLVAEVVGIELSAELGVERALQSLSLATTK